MLLAKLNNEPKPSEDYAGLVKQLRFIDEDTLNIEPYSCEQLCKSAADAIEALLAERDALKAERDALKADLASARDITWFWEIVDAAGLNNVASCEKDALRKLVRDSAILDGLRAQFENVGERDGQFTLESTFQSLLDMIDLNVETAHAEIAAIEERDAAIKERDALAARLAPADDEALVEIAAYYFTDGSSWSALSERLRNTCRRDARNVIAAIRPHIEAAERERCAKIAEEGEDGSCWTASERSIAAAIRSGK